MDRSRIKVSPKCIKEKTVEHPFVELDGTFVPCCWLTTDIHRINLLKEFFGEDYNKLNLSNNTVDGIKQQWNKISNSWYNNPFATCKHTCGIIDD